MVDYRKPDLPDPGHDRYWEIQYDENFELLLMSSNPDGPYWHSQALATEYIEDPTATHFEKAAHRMLERLDKVAAFVGTYNKTEENN